MSKTKLTDTEKLILERIKSYFDDQITLNKYKEQLECLKEDNSNSIAKYGTEYIKINSVSSKVVNHIVKKENISEKILELHKKITELQNAIAELKEGQQIVIKEIMIGTRMTAIAKKTGKSKQQIYKLRKNALKNIKKFLEL